MHVSIIFLHTIGQGGGPRARIRLKGTSNFRKKNRGNNIDNDVLSMCSWLRKQCKYRVFTYIEESNKAALMALCLSSTLL